MINFQLSPLYATKISFNYSILVAWTKSVLRSKYLRSKWKKLNCNKIRINFNLKAY